MNILQWELSCTMQMGRHTDRHNKSNIHSSNFVNMPKNNLYMMNSS
jgi:hypothetical protein